MFKKMLSVLLAATLIFGGRTSVCADSIEVPEGCFEVNGEIYENLVVELETDVSDEVVAGQEVTFELSITNPNDKAVNHVFTGLGRLNYDEGCFDLFTEIEESEDYEIVQDLEANQYDAYIDSLGAGQTVAITFTGNIWGSWAEQDVDIIAATFVQPEAVNGQDFGFIDEQWVTTHVNYPWEIERGYTLDGESVDLNDISMIFPGQELTYSFTVRNVTEAALEHVWVGCGVYDPEGCMSEIIATESDKYEATENGAYIALLGAGEAVTVEFACVIDEDWARAEEICFVNGVTQTKEEPYDAEPVCYEHFFDANHILKPLEVKLEMDAPKQIATGREVTFTASITNPNSVNVNHVFTGLGRWNEEEVKFDLFTDIVSSDAYKIYKDLDKNQYDAYMATIDAGKTVKVTFKGVIEDEWAGKDVDFVLATFIQPEAVNGGDFYFIDEQAITASVYKVESNTSNSVSKEEILAKPVENITVVKDEATENAVKLELFELVDKIMLGELATGVGDDGFPQKVKHAVESGKNITSELIVEEIKEESVATIPQEVRVEIEKEAVAELGEDTKIQYMDICIMIKADDSELGTLSELQEELAITIAIPESLKGENYLYKVIRNHNGEITTLDTIDNGDGTITFKTDHFSTYALAYNEEKAVNPNGPAVPENPTNPNEPAVPENPTNPNEPAVPENPEKPDEPAVPENPEKTEESATSEEQQESVTQNPTSESPKTMDNSMMLVYVCILLCGILVKVVWNRKRV